MLIGLEVETCQGKIVEVGSDEITLYPFGGVRIVVSVFYEFVRCTAYCL